MAAVRGRVILSLCDHSGVWPGCYREAGYDVRTVDLQSGPHVRGCHAIDLILGKE